MALLLGFSPQSRERLMWKEGCGQSCSPMCKAFRFPKAHHKPRGKWLTGQVVSSQQGNLNYFHPWGRLPWFTLANHWGIFLCFVLTRSFLVCFVPFQMFHCSYLILITFMFFYPKCMLLSQQCQSENSLEHYQSFLLVSHTL